MFKKVSVRECEYCGVVTKARVTSITYGWLVLLVSPSPDILYFFGRLDLDWFDVIDVNSRCTLRAFFRFNQFVRSWLKSVLLEILFVYTIQQFQNNTVFHIR